MSESIILEGDIYDSVDTDLVDSLTWAWVYRAGLCKPNYPVPAVIFAVAITPFDEESPYYDSVSVWQLGLCDCCGGYTSSLVALWDFDVDRAMDFFLPLGRYVNSREMDEGIAAYKEFGADVSIQ